MKKSILKSTLFCALFTLFALSFNTMSEAAAIGGGGGNIECQGTAGHCMEYKGATYYGKLVVGDKKVTLQQ